MRETKFPLGGALIREVATFEQVTIRSRAVVHHPIITLQQGRKIGDVPELPVLGAGVFAEQLSRSELTELVLRLFNLSGLESDMVASFTPVNQPCQPALPVGASPEHEAVAATGADVLDLCQTIPIAVETHGEIPVSRVRLVAILKSHLQGIGIGFRKAETTAFHRLQYVIFLFGLSIT